MIHSSRGNFNQYKETDCGRWGKATECSYTGEDTCRPAGKVDLRDLFKNFEIKTGAGELANKGGRLLKGVSKVVFVPVAVVAPDGYVYADEQEGFVLSRQAFLDGLEAAGAIREKTSTAGVRKVTIQTFWNHSKNAPHGKLYERILDEMYTRCECTIEEYLKERGV